MLDVIRQRAQSWIAWVIVGALIVTFALWGVNSYFSGASQVNVAVVNGHEISQTTLERAYQRQRQQLRERLGENFDPDMFDPQRMKEQVLEQLINRRLLSQAAQDMGLRVSDPQVGAEIRSIPALQQDGQFDPARYRQLVAAQGRSVAEFEAGVRQDLVTEQLRQGIQETIFVTPQELNAYLRLREQTREVGYLQIPVDRFVGQIKVEDEAVQRYYDNNQQRFSTPEQVKLRYVELSRDRLAETLEVSEEELRQRYEERTSEFTQAEERRVRHILIEVGEDASEEAIQEAREEARSLMEQLEQGANFDELAAVHSDDIGSAQSGGDLGYISRNTMAPAFDEAVFSAAVGKLQGPVRSQHGFHIIEVTDSRGGETKPFKEVRDQLAREVRQQRAEAQFFEQAEQLANLAFENPQTLEVAADQLGLQVQSSEFFSRNEGQGIAREPDVREAAFSDAVLRQGHNSELLELTVDRLVVVRVAEHRPSRVRPLDEVRSQVVDILKQQQAQDKAQALGEKILQQIREGVEAEAVAERHNLDWQRSGPVRRQNRELPQPLVEAAFRLPKPSDGPVFDTVEVSSGYGVVGVYAVQPGDPEAVGAEARQQAENQLRQARANAQLEQYLAALAQEADVRRLPENL